MMSTFSSFPDGFRLVNRIQIPVVEKYLIEQKIIGHIGHPLGSR
jgi:hypothetical protein